MISLKQSHMPSLCPSCFGEGTGATPSLSLFISSNLELITVEPRLSESPLSEPLVIQTLFQNFKIPK